MTTLDALVAEARREALDTARVQELFRLLDLPLEMARFPKMLMRLLHSLSQIQNMWPLELQKLNLLWLPPLVGKLSSLFPEPEGIEPRDSVVELIKTSNPLYSVLVESCQISDNDLRTKYDLLLAHVLLAQVMNATAPENPIEFPPYEACLAVRMFALRKFKSEDLLDLLPVHKRPAAFARTVRLYTVPNADRRLHSRVLGWIGHIARFLEGVYDLRDRRNIGEHSRSRSDLGDPNDPNANVGDATAHEQNPGDLERKKRLVRGGGNDNYRLRRRNEALDADNCPEEDDDEDEQILASSFASGGATEGKSHFDRNPESYRGMIRAMPNQVIRENKNFAFSYERLMPFELAKIEIECRRNLERLLQLGLLSEDQREKAEDFALLLATLWIGKGRAPYLVIVKDESDQLESQHAIVLPTDNTPAMFRMHVEFPKYKRVQERQDGDRKRFPYVLLPDYFNLSGLLLRLYDVQLGCQPQGEEKGRIFPREREQYSRLTKLLEKLDPSQHMTMSKLSSAFSGYITSRTGNDVVAAKIITGFDSRVSRVAMFYACRSQTNINRIFHECATWLLQAIWEESQTYKELPTKYIDPAWKDRFIGIRLCPRRDVVSLGISKMLAAIRRPGIPLKDCHDLLTLYTVLFFGYATLIRGILNPLVLKSAVSELTQMALVRDKTSDAGEKAKYVYIPDSLRDHLAFFDEHLKRPDLIKDPTRTFFFYKEGGGFEDVRPSTVSKRLEQFIPFPAAVHRRFSFNELIEAGCPPEAVRVCMGHATIGDEPWSGFATFSFSKYRKLLRNYVEPLLTSLGFISLGKSSRQEGD